MFLAVGGKKRETFWCRRRFEHPSSFFFSFPDERERKSVCRSTFCVDRAKERELPGFPPLCLALSPRSLDSVAVRSSKGKDIFLSILSPDKREKRRKVNTHPSCIVMGFFTSPPQLLVAKQVSAHSAPEAEAFFSLRSEQEGREDSTVFE